MSSSPVSASTPSAYAETASFADLPTNPLNPATLSPRLFPPSETDLLYLRLSPANPFSGHLSDISSAICPPFDSTFLFNPIDHKSPSPLNPSQISTAEEWHEWAPTPPPEFISTAEQVAQIASTSPIVQSLTPPSLDLPVSIPLAALEVHPHAHPTSSAIAIPNPSSDLVEPNLLATAPICNCAPASLVNTSSDFLTAPLSSVSASSSSSSSAVSSSQNQEVGPTFYGSTFLPSIMPGSQFAAPLPFGFSPFNPYPYPVTMVPTLIPMFATPLGIYNGYFGMPALSCFPLNTAMPPQAPYEAASLLPSMAHSSQPLPTASSSSSASATSASHLSRKRTAEAANLSSNDESHSKRTQIESSSVLDQEVISERIRASLAPRIQFAEQALQMLQSERLISRDPLENLAAKLTASLLIDPLPAPANDTLQKILDLFQFCQNTSVSRPYTVLQNWITKNGLSLRHMNLPRVFQRPIYLRNIVDEYLPREIAFGTKDQPNCTLFSDLLDDMVTKSPAINALIKKKIVRQNKSYEKASQSRSSQSSNFWNQS